MTTKFFVTMNGSYVGGFDGVEPPEGSIEVSFAPDDAQQVWEFTSQEWGPIPPLTDYTLPAALPWARMQTNEEAELVQDEIDASPAKNRNIINKAISFTTGTDAFSKFKSIIASALNQSRANDIMSPPLPSELASSAPEAA